MPNCVEPSRQTAVLDVRCAGRMTLLLGPPGGGKSVLLQALSGRLRPHRHLRVGGVVKFNGVPLAERQPRRTAGLVAQRDAHIPGGWGGLAGAGCVCA